LSVRRKLTLSYAGFLMLAGVLMLAAVWEFYLLRLPMTSDRVTILPSRYLVIRHFAPTAAIVLASLQAGLDTHRAVPARHRTRPR
jgi:two-component system sensor histidine kinase VanS